jgi:hypothetical protein
LSFFFSLCFAAGTVLPKKVEEWASIDEYYLQHCRWVLG